MPRDSYLKRVEEDHAPYDQWVREGWIELTDGNVIDYDVIRDRILEDAKANPVPGAGVRSLECDPTLHPVDVRRDHDGRGAAGLRQYVWADEGNRKAPARREDPPRRKSRATVDGVQLCGDGGPAGNKKPAKNKSNGRIDGVVAMIVGFARAVVAPPEPPPPSVWTMG
jgi:hypothetical protein